MVRAYYELKQSDPNNPGNLLLVDTRGYFEERIVDLTRERVLRAGIKFISRNTEGEAFYEAEVPECTFSTGIGVSLGGMAALVTTRFPKGDSKLVVGLCLSHKGRLRISSEPSGTKFFLEEFDEKEFRSKKDVSLWDHMYGDFKGFGAA